MQIFDPLRKKHVNRTPEEEVRQAIIRWLADDRKVPMTLMASEYSFTFNGRQYRSDIVVFDRELNPLMMVECKAPSVSLDRDVIDQVIRYNKVLKVRFILISNGKTSYLCAWNPERGLYEFSDRVPEYQEMIQQ